ncbi:hypothetical protein HAX54_032195, partial [Datura stramonium]|nr:hypothetical protein [Datura stramonium]
GKEKVGKFSGYIPDGPHMARDCPKREKLVNILQAETDEEAQQDEEPVSFRNPLHVLNKQPVDRLQIDSLRAKSPMSGGGLLAP